MEQVPKTWMDVDASPPKREAKIHSTSTFIEIPETLEEGSAKIHCEKPYQIERLEKNGEIIWYGYNTNWKYSNYAWSKLEGGEFIPCEEPEYETIYKELIR